MQKHLIAAVSLLVGFEVSASGLVAGPPASCSAPQPICQSCLPECSVCNGQGICWDCSWEEGIDIDSLTPAAQSKKLYLASQARILMEVPEASGVWLLDQRMSMLGAKRMYQIPIPDQSKDYRYEIKVDIVSNGKKYFKRIRLDEFRAGKIVAIKVDAPPAPEGEIPEIIVETNVLAEGGEPPQDDEDEEVMVYQPAFR